MKRHAIVLKLVKTT